MLLKSGHGADVAVLLIHSPCLEFATYFNNTLHTVGFSPLACSLGPHGLLLFSHLLILEHSSVFTPVSWWWHF